MLGIVALELCLSEASESRGGADQVAESHVLSAAHFPST